MDKFAKALSEVLAESKGIEIPEDEVENLLESADKKTEPGVLRSFHAAHNLLDQMGVPKSYADGNEASLDARLVAYIRYVQSSGGGGCSGGCCQ